MKPKSKPKPKKGKKAHRFCLCPKCLVKTLQIFPPKCPTMLAAR